MKEWVESYKLGKILFIDVDNLKFSESSEQLASSLKKSMQNFTACFKHIRK